MHGKNLGTNNPSETHAQEVTIDLQSIGSSEYWTSGVSDLQTNQRTSILHVPPKKFRQEIIGVFIILSTFCCIRTIGYSAVMLRYFGQLLEFRTIGTSEYWAFVLTDLRSIHIRPSEYWNLGFRSIDPSEHKAVTCTLILILFLTLLVFPVKLTARQGVCDR